MKKKENMKNLFVAFVQIQKINISALLRLKQDQKCRALYKDKIPYTIVRIN